MGQALVARDLRLAYGQPRGKCAAVLDVARLHIADGLAVGITGPSGSGKTSLLQVLTGLAPLGPGRVIWGGTDVGALSEGERDRWRRRSVGFVFQEFHLFPGLDALGNVLLPATFDHVRIPREIEDRGRELLARVGVANRDEPVDLLSRGERQRVAIARALLGSPPIVVADEPTASLDPENGRLVAALLLELCRDGHSTAVIASHDTALLGRLDRVHRLEAGRLLPIDPPATTAA